MSAEHGTLSVLLSHALLAFTIEFDNEFERRLVGPSGLTFKEWRKSPERIFLVSLVMWANYLRFVPGDGISVGELTEQARQSRIDSVLNGFKRWRYVVAEPPQSGTQPPARDWIVRPTPHLVHCQELWSGLAQLIEGRWRERFGKTEVETLRQRLWAFVKLQDARWPQYLPIVSSQNTALAFSSEVSLPAAVSASWGNDARESEMPLFALLAQVLLTYTLDLEEDSDVAMPVGANALRPLSERWVPIRDLPVLSGVSKESVAQVLTLLRRKGWVLEEPIPPGRGKQVRLTGEGLEAQAQYTRLVDTVEARWRSRSETGPLRESLQAIVGDDLASSRLSTGLVPPDHGWRAAVPRPEVLPDHPMVLVRGGWPDGS